MAEDITKKEVIDPEYEAVKKSMGNRMDPDITEEKAPVIEKVEEVAPVVAETKEDKPVVEAPVTEPVIPKDENKSRVERPEAYIPMPKYLSEKKEWEKTAEKAESLAKRVEELEAIDRSGAGTKTQDQQLLEFSEKHGMEIDAVKDLLGIVQSAILPEEKLKKLDSAIEIADKGVREDQIKQSQEAFKKEFEVAGLPELKKKYPDATPEQLLSAQNFLDKAAHTEKFAKSELGYVIYSTSDELAKIFASTVETEPEKPSSRTTMEHGRPGGKNSTLTANDFKGKTDFSDLLALDPQLQQEIRKGFDTPTYASWMKFVVAKDKESGVEVMRNGRKITLK